MTGALADLAAWTREGLALAFVVFLRVGAVMALMPGFGQQGVPQRVRLVLALAFTAVVFPAVAPTLPADMTGAMPWRFVLTETVAGLSLGIVMRLIIVALQFAGALAAQATSLAQLFGGAAAEPLPAMGNLMVVSALALAAMQGLHVKIAAALILSYDTLPAGQMPLAGGAAEWGIGRIAEALALGFSLAGPFLIASLIYNVALGVINRAMPQLMVAFVGAPAITFGGLVLLAVTLPLMLPVWLAWADGLLANPFEARP
ncbi:flagellar biosynthetic protein FliR [Rhodovulum sp. YNF3179]|uniref:flagellar biosynthetic protein FliR n=1 Tax=Rhodovulum sp. YNF3179 TaxID=3425127 RepID=UPI003D3368D8